MPHQPHHRPTTRVTRPFTRRRTVAALLATTIVTATILVACHDLTAPASPAHLTPANVVAIPGDPGAPEAIFLPPLGPRKRPHGVLDTTLAPSVTVCRLAGDGCGADTLARFASDSTLPDSLRVKLATQAYVARWRTGALPADTTAAYRVSITLGDTTVGAIDVRIVPDSFVATAADSARYALIQPRAFTPIRFQIFVPADTLYVITDPGVHGTLVPGATTIRHGANVPYRFQLDSGYTNLLVSVDDQLVSSNGHVRMTGSHVLVASADRRPGVPDVDQPILVAATALARSPSAAAAQRLLDRIDALDDTTDLDQRLRQVEYTVLQRQGTGVIAAIDAALDGHAFHAGDGTGEDEAGDPGGTGAPGVPMVRLVPRTPTLVPRATLLAPAPAPARDVVTTGRLIAPEPLTIGFVNGVMTTPFGALFGANAIARLARSTRWGTPVPFDVRLIYNRSGTGRYVADDCTRDIAAIAWAIGRNSIVRRLGACLGEAASEVVGSLADFAEAGGQLAAILARANTYRPSDADSVAELTTRWRRAGRHVLLVGHSQGNLMLQQGVARLTDLGRYRPATDTTCIGAVSLAAPTSANWPLAPRHLDGLVVENDAILLLGANRFPQIHTELDDSAAADLLVALRNHAPATAGAALLGWRVRLHSLVDSYLRREPIRSAVQHAMAHQYHACALGGIETFPSLLHLQPGTTTKLGAMLLDMNGDPLDGTRGFTWAMGSGFGMMASASVMQDGTVHASYVGTTSARAETRSRSVDVPIVVEPLPIVPAIVETLSGYWSIVPGYTYGSPDATSLDPSLAYSQIPAGWGGCGSHMERVVSGWTTLYSHTCVAHYQVTVPPVANAAQFQATFFAVGDHAPLGTVTRNSASIPLDLVAPRPSPDDLPGPPLVDRVAVVVRDANGHMLASGDACVRGCAGW